MPLARSHGGVRSGGGVRHLVVVVLAPALDRTRTVQGAVVVGPGAHVDECAGWRIRDLVVVVHTPACNVAGCIDGAIVIGA